MDGPRVSLCDEVSDDVKTSTCYMCACRCGIRVYLRDGDVRYIEGNPLHPVNKGVLCAKGSAGIMQHLSPARLSKPLLRVGERGAGEFREIEWDEALSLAVERLSSIRESSPKSLAFFSGRDQSQSLTGWWAQQFGTPNYAAHGGFCSVNMAAGGFYSIGGSFWEFGEPDWSNARYLLMFGVAEDHDSNPIKIGLSTLKRNGAKCLSINPVRTGYSAIADEWLSVRSGSDAFFVASLIYLFLQEGCVDEDFLRLHSNSAHLIIDEPDAEDDGLFLRDKNGVAYIYDEDSKKARIADKPYKACALRGKFKVKGRRVKPAFDAIQERFSDDIYTPENTAEKTGIAAKDCRRIAQEISEVFHNPIEIKQNWSDTWGQQHSSFKGRPIAVHAMRGISAHTNGFHTCRMIHLMQMILGTIDTPGGFIYKPPYPKACPPAPKPHGKGATANTPINGAILGYPLAPEDLLLENDGSQCRIDKGFSWEYPLSAHGMMHMVIHNAAKQDPYPIDVLFLYMANMAWNSSMNIKDTLHYLTDKDDKGDYKIKFIIYADAYDSEMVSYADLILPDTTYLERWDCISMLDRPISSGHSAADAIRQPVVKPNRNVRAFQDVLIELGVRLKLDGFVDDEGKALYKDYADYIVNHQRSEGIGPLSGWRGSDGSLEGKGASNPLQLEAYIENGCFWETKLDPSMHYCRNINQDYLDYACSMGWVGKADAIMLTPYNECLQKFRLASRGYGDVVPPKHLRQRIGDYFDPIALAYLPFESASSDGDYPLYALTQRPMFQYHSWGSQNSWLRQLANSNYLYMHVDMAGDLDIADGSWVWVESRIARIRVRVKLMRGCDKNTVWTWNAVGKRRGKWGLDAKAEENHIGFLLNHLIPENLPNAESSNSDSVTGVFSNSDPVTGQAAWYDLRVRVYACEDKVDDSCSPLLESLPSLGVGCLSAESWGKRCRRDVVSSGVSASLREWLGFGNDRGGV